MVIEIEKKEVVITVQNLEISGIITKDGFEPFYFSSESAEEYYSENWESIEEQIIKKLL
jgi:hypothetical protein